MIQDYGGSGVPSGLSGVKAIYSTGFAFAALKEDGTVEAWGSSSYGGSGVPSGLSGVKAIYSTNRAFAALKEDGTVEAWGNSTWEAVVCHRRLERREGHLFYWTCLCCPEGRRHGGGVG